MIHLILFTFLPIILDALRSCDNSLSDWVFVNFKLIIQLYVSNGIITISKTFIADKAVRWHFNFAKRWSQPLAFLYACSKLSSSFKFLSSWLPRYLYVVALFMMLPLYLIGIHFDFIDKCFAVPKTIASVTPFFKLMITITRKITHLFIQNFSYNINVTMRVICDGFICIH